MRKHMQSTARRPLPLIMVLMLSLSILFFAGWGVCVAEDVSASFKELYSKSDGRWGARFVLKNNTANRAVTKVIYKGGYLLDGQKKTFGPKGGKTLSLASPIQPGKTHTLNILLWKTRPKDVRNMALSVPSYSYLTVKRHSKSEKTASSDDLGNKLATTVQKYEGVKYVWGGTTPKGFDCSGLVLYVCKQHGITIPRTSPEQARKGKPVAQENLRPGDLVFFGRTSSGPVDHAGMYIGDDIYVHAPGPGQPVMKTRLSDNSFMKGGVRYVFQGKYVTARRVTP